LENSRTGRLINHATNSSSRGLPADDGIHEIEERDLSVYDTAFGLTNGLTDEISDGQVA
jgi:hypothetical protein